MVKKNDLGLLTGILGLVCLSACLKTPDIARVEQSWQKSYTDENATGVNILALWPFETNAPARDVSGKGHDLKLRGQSAFAPNGKFGSCLESFATGPDGKPNGAETTKSAGLTPAGAFTLEMWLKSKPEIVNIKQAILLDKMYVPYKHSDPKMECQRDYWLALNAITNGEFCLEVNLGFGEDIAVFKSRAFSFEPEKWCHLAFTYDARGTGTIYRDGAVIGSACYPERRSVVGGKYSLVIGDRGCSSYGGFPGFIDQVRICEGLVPFSPADPTLYTSVTAQNRTSFVRMEKGKGMELTVYNNLSSPLLKAGLVVTVEDEKHKELNRQSMVLPEVAARSRRDIDYVLDTSVRPGKYTVKVQAFGPGKVPYSREEVFPVVIVSRPLPLVMPVVMWGGINVMDENKLKLAREIGFTMSMDSPSVDYSKIWKEGASAEAAQPEAVDRSKRMLNYVLANDFKVAGYIYPGSFPGMKEQSEKFCRVDRQGKPYADKEVNPCGLFEEVQKFCHDTGVSFARTYGHFPALAAVLIHSEVWDNTKLCFHEHDKAAYRKFAGMEIPDQAATAWGGIDYRAIKDFPINRVVPDEYPVLKYYRWFWKEGHGWNILHSQVHGGLKSIGRNDWWTWFDPAVRLPSVYGSGGAVDVISEWTYSSPDPLQLGRSADQLFAMVKGGRAGQKVMKMTQIIWYRSVTAPKPKAGEENKLPKAPWEEVHTNADFITIAPDHLREAFWSEISRPVQGIMYHGWESLVETENKWGGYRYTHPETKEVLKELTHTVVQPLGPMLLQVPDRPADVALLESFSSQIMAGRMYVYGADYRLMPLVLQYAQIQPEIVYEETVMRNGLGAFKVLVMPDCDILPEGVMQKVKEFQARGGIVVGDENLCPAIIPDILQRSYVRMHDAARDKEVLQAKARELREQVDAFYEHYSDSSNPDVVTRVRRYGNTDYLFVVNDHREYGDYVGHHRLVMEKGLPSKARVSMKKNGGHIYDLVKGEEVKGEMKDGRLEFNVELGPGGGNVYMVTEKAIGGVKVIVPEKVKLGKRALCRIELNDETGRVMQGAVAPVKVEIKNGEGREIEFSGYYGVKDGAQDISLDIAKNDLAGDWRITVNDLASGKKAEKTIKVIP